MIVSINSELHINPEHVTSVTIPSESSNAYIAITMSTGDRHIVQHDYGRSIYQTLDRIVKLINK